MDTKKIRKSIETAMCLLSAIESDSILQPEPVIKLLIEAIAELEKQDADAMMIAKRWFNNKYVPTLVNTMAKDIQQYAESYHAKKCAECNRKERRYYPLGKEPIEDELCDEEINALV